MPDFLDLHGKTNKAVRAAVDAALRRHGLRLGQDHLLAALWEQDGRSPGEIAAATNVTTPAVTKVAARMVDAGLLDRRRDERDNRLVRGGQLGCGRRGGELRLHHRQFLVHVEGAPASSTSFWAWDKTYACRARGAAIRSAEDPKGSPIGLWRRLT